MPQTQSPLTPPPGALPNLGLAPTELADAFRRAFPQYHPEITDPADLYTHLRTTYPDQLKKLIDPALEGSETLPSLEPPPLEPPTRVKRTLGQIQDATGYTDLQTLAKLQRESGNQIPTRNAAPNTATTLATTGLRLAPPLLTGVATGNPLMAAAAGGAGETLAQGLETELGFREKINPLTVASATAFSAIPGAKLSAGAGTLLRVGARGAEGAGLGLVQQEIDRRLEGREAPSLGERATVGAFGAVLGGGFGALDAHLTNIANEAADAAEQIRRRTLTREGLAGTITRIAGHMEAAGHPPADARRYAAKAARALYQGRAVPDPPPAPVAHGMEPPPQADSFGPVDAGSQRAGEALGQSLEQGGATVRPPRLVNPEAGTVTLPDREITIPPPPEERAAGQQLAADLDRAAGQSLADDIARVKQGVLARDKINKQQGRQLANDIKTVKQGGTLPAEPAQVPLRPSLELAEPPTVDVGEVKAQADADLERIRAEAARVAGQRAMEATQGGQSAAGVRKAAEHGYMLTHELEELKPPPQAHAPEPAPAIEAPPTPQRRATDAGYSPEAQRAQMLELAKDPEAIAGARNLMRRKGDIDAARKAGARAIEPPPTGKIGDVRTVPSTSGEAAPRAVEVRPQVDPDTGQPIRMFRVEGGSSSGSTVSEPRLRELGIAVPGAEEGARPPAKPRGATPDRRLRVGFGAHGQREVIFPDKLHADLFAASGRSRRALNPQGGKQGTANPRAHAEVAAQLGIPYETVADRVHFHALADEYRRAVLAEARKVPEGGTYNAFTSLAVSRARMAQGKHPLNPAGEKGALNLEPPPPVDFDVAPGDTPRLKQWMAERQGIFGGKGWYKEAATQLARGNEAAAWKRIMAERVRQLPKAERQKLLKFGRFRGDVVQTKVGQTTKGIPLPPEVKRTQQGKIKMLHSGLLAPVEADTGLPPATKLPTLTSEVVGQIARRADRAKVAWIAGNKDAAYRVSRQIVHQMLTDDPSFRAVREVLGMSREEMARGFASVVTESARTLQKLAAFAREAPPAFVEKLEQQVGKLPEDLRQIESESEGQAGVVKLYGGLFGIDPSEAAEWVAKAAKAQDQLHTEWLLSKELPKSGPLRSYLSLTTATLTGTVEQFWRNGLMGVLRWNATGVRDLLAAGYAGLYDPAEAKILFARAKDRLTANPELVHAWARPWGDTMTEKWPAIAGSLEGLSDRDVRHTLKWLSEAPEQAGLFLGTHASDQPVGQVESKVTKALQIWNRMQEYPLRAIAADVRMRTEMRRRGFDPNQVIAQGVPLKTVFGSDEGAQRALMLSAKDALELTYANSPIRGTLNQKLISLFQQTPILNLFQRFPRFAWSAAPRQFWDFSPASLVEFLTVTQNRGRFTHGRAVRKIMDSLLPAREQRLTEIGQREGDVLRQRMALSADRRVLLRSQASLEKQQAALAAGGKTKLSADEIAAKLAETQGRLRSTTNTISALHGSWQAIKAERKVVLEQAKNLKKSFERSSDAMAPESAAEVLANATVGSLLTAGAYTIASQVNQRDLPWYKIRVGEPGSEHEHVFDIRAFGGFAQYFYLGHTYHEIISNLDRSRWEQARLEGKSLADSVDAAYTGKYTLGSFLAEGAQALLAMNPVAGGTATLLDFLQPQNLDAEGLQQAMKEFAGEMVGALFQPLTSYKNLYSAVDPNEEIIRDFNPTPENPAGGMASFLGKIPGVSQLAPALVSQTSGTVMRSQSAWTRPTTGLTLAAPPNRVERELADTGVPGAAYSVPRLHDTGLNQELSRVHAQSLAEAFDQLVWNNPAYTDLRTPEERRRYLANGAGSFEGVLAYAKKLTWARMLEYGPLRVLKLRGMDPTSRLAPDLQLLERWRDAEAARDRSSAPAAAPAGGAPPARPSLPSLPPPPR